jgi:hypothetical protein
MKGTMTAHSYERMTGDSNSHKCSANERRIVEDFWLGPWNHASRGQFGSGGKVAHD